MCRVHTRQCSIVGSLLDDKKVPTISGIYKSEGVLRVLRTVEGSLVFQRNTTWDSARGWRCGGGGVVMEQVWMRWCGCRCGGGADADRAGVERRGTGCDSLERLSRSFTKKNSKRVRSLTTKTHMSFQMDMIMKKSSPMQTSTTSLWRIQSTRHRKCIPVLQETRMSFQVRTNTKQV